MTQPGAEPDHLHRADNSEPPPPHQPPPPGLDLPEKKKKRLTQACQHCRKKKIRCDGIRPSCKNCIKNKTPCAYLPSIRKRGRNNGIRVPMMSFIGGAGGPFDRTLALSSHAGSAAVAAAAAAAGDFGVSPPQHVHLLSPNLQQPPPAMLHPGTHRQGMHTSQPRPQLQINPMSAAFGSDGPASLHLKRDPGFGGDAMGDGMFDPAKQANEMSTHFLQPVNAFRFPQYTPSNQMSLGAQPGPSNSSRRSSNNNSSHNSHTNGAMPGSSSLRNPYQTLHHSSSAGPSARADSFGREPASGMGMGLGPATATPLPSGLPVGFNPMLLAQDLSSAYASVMAGVPHTGQPQPHQPQHAGAPCTARPEPPLSAPARPSKALGKSASHTPDTPGPEGGVADPHAAAKMRDLKRSLRAIISSVWADTECGRSAGMAGVTLEADDDEQGGMTVQSPDPSRANRGRADTGAIGSSAPASHLASPPGDSSLEAHLVNTFFECVHHQLPIIARDEFSDAYRHGRVPSLLVYAMCAAASIFLNRIEDERKAIYEKYSQKVREQFHDACFEPTLEVVQTALIMTLCEYRHGSLHRAWVYLSMGFRLAIAMGYHHHDAKLRAGPVQSSADIARRETCRRAFWGAFLLDRYTAIGGGKALGINDDDIAVLLPLSDEDWQSRSAAPPLSVLEFFRPISSTPAQARRSTSVGSTVSAAKFDGARLTSQSSRSGSGGFDSDVSSPLTGTSAGSMGGPPVSTTGWGARLGDVGALGHFIKLMTVVGQVAQHVNGPKGGTSSAAADHAPKRERPSRDCAMLDAALLRWKEELPPWLGYAEARSADTRPEAAVFVSCMHAIYHGAVIMLNRENMGLLRDLPGRLDVSTNLAILSLERCRVAAMEVVEIAHHICSLPSAMTNALLPWALFQAGTLLVHFMIAGNSAQAQEEARAAILSLDSALRDGLSRYWSVSFKYHLVLSTMVKAWERMRQATPSMALRRPSATPSATGQPWQMQAPVDLVSGKSASESFHAFSPQFQLPVQLQMPMQHPAHVATAAPQQLQQRPPGDNAFSTPMKPFAAPTASAAQSVEQQEGPSNTRATTADDSLLSGFVFSPDTAQDSLNTLSAFFAQLSEEQARQVSEGMSIYALHGARASSGQVEPGPATSEPLYVRTPTQPPGAALDHLRAPAGFDLIRRATGADDDRRESLPISRSGDLFTAPGGHLFSSSSIHADGSVSASLARMSSEVLMSAELDPLLFNPMSPFLQELQLFNSPHAHAPASAGSSGSGQTASGSLSSADAPSGS